jgi:gag-polypeptide of LTR copia-type
MSSSATTATVSNGSGGTGETSIRVVMFSGKRDEWESWKEKFMVKAAIRGYKTLLTGEDKAPDTQDPKDGTKKKLADDIQELADKNKKWFGDLILSIDCTKPTGKVAFATVKNAKTKEIPGGDLFLAFTRLKTKFEPSTTPQLMQLTKEFHSKSLMRNQDPDIFITKLEALKIKLEDLDHVITEKAMVLHILNNLNKTYDMEIKLLEHHQSNERRRQRKRTKCRGSSCGIKFAL